MNKIKTIRLFTGTFLDPSVFKVEYTRIKDKFSEYLTGRWVEYENLHFTYQFIGDYPYDKITILKEKLMSLTCNYQSEISFRCISAFPDKRYPRILISPVINDDKLIHEIYNKSNNILKEFGYQVETRSFQPHITFMRIKEVKNKNLRSVFNMYAEKVIGKMESFNYNIISSELTPNGPIYRII